MNTPRILVGTASWSDPGFIADWYPKGLPANERLPWYAEHFNLVEVNSSFYAAPAVESVAHWAEQTPSNFVFDIKLHKLLSRHATELNALPTDLRGLALGSEKKVELTPRLEEAMVSRYLEAAQPLVEAGKMGAFLLQMTPSFNPQKHHLEELEPLVQMLEGHRLALELRHRDWMNNERALEVADFCEQHGVSLVMVDTPESKNFMVMPEFEAVTTPSLAYMRLHGRDAEAFTKGKTVAERFNYQYSDEEIVEIVKKVDRLGREAAEVHVVFNNNNSNYAPKSAEAFQKAVQELKDALAAQSR